MTQEKILRKGNQRYIGILAQDIQEMDILIWNGSTTEPTVTPLVTQVVANLRTCVTVDLLYPPSARFAKHYAGRGEVIRIDFERRVVTVQMYFHNTEHLFILVK